MDSITNQMPFEHQMAIEIARWKGALIQPNKPGRDKEKDFVLFVPVLVEVKNDIKSIKTGNLFLEIRNCRLNEPSGLAATKADWWCHYMPKEMGFFQFHPKQMLKWLKEKSGLVPLEGVGDGNSDGYAVSKETVKTLSFVTWHKCDFILQLPPTPGQTAPS